MLKAIHTEAESDSLITSGKAILLYFSTPECNVCKVLKPKLEELLGRDFPLIQSYFVDAEKFSTTATRYSVFAVPTLILFFEGKETIRKSRFIHLEELRREIQRLYEILFV